MSPYKKQIPNILSFSRLIFAIFCCYFAFTLNPTSLSISHGLFMVASATDYFDGYYARKWKVVSNFGKIIDPVADKVLILGVLFVFTYHGVIPFFLTAIIALREIVVTIIRFILLYRNIVLASIYSGKIKTFSQGIGLVIIYLLLIFKTSLIQYIDIEIISNVILGLVIWKVLITLYSGFEFFVENRKAISNLA